VRIDSINKWLTLIGNLGVLLGIFVLILEINQNTQAIEADVTWSHAAITTELYNARSVNPDMADIIVRFRGLSKEEIEQYEAGDDVEYFRFRNHQAVNINYWQARFLTQTSELDRERLRATLRNRLVLPGVRAVNSRPMLMDTLHPEFREFLLDIVAEFESR